MVKIKYIQAWVIANNSFKGQYELLHYCEDDRWAFKSGLLIKMNKHILFFLLTVKYILKTFMKKDGPFPSFFLMIIVKTTLKYLVKANEKMENLALCIFFLAILSKNNNKIHNK